MRRAAQASRGGHVVRASRGSSSWCVALLVACCALVHTQALELPNWHPHRFRRDGENSTSRSILTPYSRGSVFHSAYEEKPSEEAEGSWAKCLRCETGCVTHTKVPVTEALECRPCTGCSHTFYAVNGSTTFLGTEYTWEAGASAAHILRVQAGDTQQLLDPFVKFPCVPSTPKHQSKNCNVDLLNKTSATLAALQQLSEECGLDDVAVKAHIAPVRSSMPYQPWHPGQVELPGGGKVNQFGLFTEAAPGISLSNLISKSSVNAHLLGKIDSMQIQKAALYDFLFCCADRHSQNIFIDEHANIKLIDNDLLLGGAQRGRDGKGSCSPSSLFLPGNLESYRLHSSPSNLGQLDYRCHTTDHSGNLTLPAKLSQCLTTLSTTSVDAIQAKYHLPRAVAAQELRSRAADLLAVGFPEALQRSYAAEKMRMKKDPRSPKVGEPDYAHWFWNTWRPMLEPNCPEPAAAGHH